MPRWVVGFVRRSEPIWKWYRLKALSPPSNPLYQSSKGQYLHISAILWFKKRQRGHSIEWLDDIVGACNFCFQPFTLAIWSMKSVAHFPLQISLALGAWPLLQAAQALVPSSTAIIPQFAPMEFNILHDGMAKNRGYQPKTRHFCNPSRWVRVTLQTFSPAHFLEWDVPA